MERTLSVGNAIRNEEVSLTIDSMDRRSASPLYKET